MILLQQRFLWEIGLMEKQRLELKVVVWGRAGSTTNDHLVC